ncbi:MAG TPA: 4a-hydroxytetrahydrobiopterin dehydratase [Vicinamibacteria bacterium]|nr:4a-hydroxytetrahydrobiopterin dehydratase [Vicinamibacteria bacterium]
MARLSDEDARARLATLSGWVLEGASIRKVYELDGFPAAIAFVNRVAALAQAADHHPDILVEYKRVTLTLTSHDSGGLTGRDFSLAARIDG